MFAVGTLRMATMYTPGLGIVKLRCFVSIYLDSSTKIGGHGAPLPPGYYSALSNSIQCCPMLSGAVQCHVTIPNVVQF